LRRFSLAKRSVPSLFACLRDISDGTLIELGMPFMKLAKLTRAALEQEVVPSGARLELTRLIRHSCLIPDGDDDGGITLGRENEFINIANQVMGKPIYLLEGGDWGDYQPAEHAWHHGQRELIMRLPTTPELAEILADYLQRQMMPISTVNRILRDYNCGFSYQHVGPADEFKVTIIVTSEDAISEPDLSKEHPNIRKLVHRMETALSGQDYTAVLHASASVFETLAKDVINKPSVNNQTLGGIFDGFKKKSNLPAPILDYIHQIYNDRNTTPLAGHGSLSTPTLDAAIAVTLCEFTKFAVRTERSLAEQKVVLAKPQVAVAAPPHAPPTAATTAPPTPAAPSVAATASPVSKPKKKAKPPK